MTDTDLWQLATALYPLPRTVQGHAVLQTLDLIESFVGQSFARFHVPVGTKVYDWTVLADRDNRRSYHPSLDELPAFDGPLTFAELVLRGDSSKEILLSTYTCHPRMANDNVSGMVVTAALAKWLASKPRRYTYRILYAPETIGALCWLRNENVLVAKRRTIAGYTINNCGDERAWSFLPSRQGNTLSDRAARHVLKYVAGKDVRLPSFDHAVRYLDDLHEYTFADRGSDERQFCAPGIELPIASVMRSKHGTYPEYHTPNDRLGAVVTATGLGDTVRCYQRILETIEANRVLTIQTTGEPMLSRYGLYPTANGLPAPDAKLARDICAYADGDTDLIAMADAIGRPVWEILPIVNQLAAKGLLR